VSLFVATTSPLSKARPARCHGSMAYFACPHVSACLCHHCFLAHLLSRKHLPSKRRLNVTAHCRDSLPTFRCPSLFLPPCMFSGSHRTSASLSFFSPSHMFST
jgi:hypothetical protein